MQSPLSGGVNGPFSTVSVPSPLMVGYAAVYAVVFLVMAARRLETRDL